MSRFEGHTPGPWMVATSNSWRRIVSRAEGNVCEPITQRDGHPDLHFRNGGEDGPDARLIAAAPALAAENERLREALEEIDGYASMYPRVSGPGTQVGIYRGELLDEIIRSARTALQTDPTSATMMPGDKA